MSKKFRFLLVAIMLVFSGFVVFQPVTQKLEYSEKSQNAEPQFSEALAELIPPEITIATVVCSKENNTVPREEATVMIKSVIVSALLYNVSNLNFHLFVERLDDAEEIITQIKTFSKPISKVSVTFNIHSAVAAVPKEYRYHMIYHYQFRCTYVRIFLPNLLKDVDLTLYLDTDVIVTGSLVDIWNQFRSMTGEQLIGAVQNNEPDNPNWPDVYQTWFADIPHPPPRGINAGVLLMNLTKMREYEFQSKVLRLFQDYNKLYEMNDQRLLNILLRFDQGLLRNIPCQFNFKNTHCDYGLYCNGSISDPKGIHIVHGAADHFKRGETFREIYLAYKLLEDVTEDMNITNLMTRIRDRYKKGSLYFTRAGVPGNMTISKCYGTINTLLFKNYFE